MTSGGGLHEGKLDKREWRTTVRTSLVLMVPASGSADGEPLRRNPPAQAKIEAGGRNDLRIGKLALVGAEVTLEILLRDEAACDQFFPNIQDEIAKDGPSAVAGRCAWTATSTEMSIRPASRNRRCVRRPMKRSIPCERAFSL